MVYNSFLFIWLFPIIFMVGNNLTVPYRKYFFLLASYGIYIYYNKWMTLTLIAVSLISYFFAKYLDRNQNKYLEKDQEKELEKNLRKDQEKNQEKDLEKNLRKDQEKNQEKDLKKDLRKNLRKDPDKKNCGKETICGKGTICAGVIATILPLVVFKYGHFISENLSSFTDCFGLTSGSLGMMSNLDDNHFSIIAPLGISFFTFQALSYVFDVYRKKYPAEQKLSNYLTYMAFFPSMIAGPINRYDQLMPQLNTVQGFNRPLAEKGLKMILWGMFLKVVIADRLQLYIDPVFDGFLQESGSSLLMAAILYSIQLYTDFAGYSLMAIGAAATLGYNLKQNFHNPYFSIGITDFWHRWHITLAHWLRDYIYIPLGGSRCSKRRNYANILITFAVSGIWHGANWTFIVWGLLHGLFQVIEKMLGLQKKKESQLSSTDIESSSIKQRNFSIKDRSILLARIILTFFLITFLWIFFRMNTIEDAWIVIEKIFTSQDMHFGICEKFIYVFIAIVFIKDLIDEIRPSCNPFYHSKTWVRWATYLFIFTSILLFGVFDAGQFIYARF